MDNDDDEIVAEVRRTREQLAARFNFDLTKLLEDARQRQKHSGHKVVSFVRRKAPTGP